MAHRLLRQWQALPDPTTHLVLSSPPNVDPDTDAIFSFPLLRQEIDALLRLGQSITIEEAVAHRIEEFERAGRTDDEIENMIPLWAHIGANKPFLGGTYLVFRVLFFLSTCLSVGTRH